LGYDRVAEIVKKSIEKNKTLREVVIGEKYLLEKEFDKIINSFNI
jgi:fumarate hydratase class II